ncbi:MAG TPA: hypothetical protein VNH18_13290 [Bryobacteraceae bacterium]|nr:hypothetical protein [Bryobacteraceae bacterium]
MMTAATQANAAGEQTLPLPAMLPPPPTRIEDLGIPEHLLIDIAIRHVYMRGVCTIHLWSELLKVSLEVAEAVFRRLNEQQLVEIRRMLGDDYVFALSATGRRAALERASTLRYAGPVPVSLQAWSEVVRSQKATTRVTRESLRRAFSDIVVRDQLIDALGPALISQRSLFLYGPSGTGKTTISERLPRVYEDSVLVPWAVEVEGQIVTVFDPAVHEQIGAPPLYLDARWVVSRRPLIAAGGELVTSMLDLQRDESSCAWGAPLQMKANNGILLIDDFGRQLMSPRDLLNRWIVPLDRRIDFLSLGGGAKFAVPFECMVVFSTNLEPHELADEAFLRRIPNKIFVAPVAAEVFDAIFRLTAEAFGMACGPDSASICRELCLQHSPDLRPCFPRDLFESIRAVSMFAGEPANLTREALERAVAGYFV